jgi:omega-amidase
VTDLRISLVQTDLLWCDPAGNRARLDAELAPLAGITDLIVLPEMFTTAFTDRTEWAEPTDGPTVQWMLATAAHTGACVTGSLMVKDNGIAYNRLVWARPDGTFATYDKRHLFTFAGEHHTYSPGKERLIVEWKGWRICPLVCYDLRFPEWARNTATDGTSNTNEGAYDLLIYVANWPEVRSRAWKDLLVARAHENLAYVAGVNRIGTDGLGHRYSGDSVLHGPMGEVIAACPQSEQAIASATISLGPLVAYRQRFPALADADRYTLRH